MLIAVLILIALIAGYLVHMPLLSSQFINKLLRLIIGVIIFVMGYNFGIVLLEMTGQITGMIWFLTVFIFILLLANIICIKAFTLMKPAYRLAIGKNTQKTSNPFIHILHSSSYLLYLACGTILGVELNYPVDHIGGIIDAILLLTLFLIGIQLNREGHSLTQILKNKTGIAIALIVIISSLITGAITGILFGIPLKTALMISSGFGWYSLSSILNAQLINAHFGTITFFIDFSREILAIILIPMLAHKMPTTLIGYSGATAMDFTLPVIKEHIGVHAIAVAISSGFVLTLVTPILIPLLNLLPM
ncbi:MAG: lysine exporter LysO family protein [Francisellaceae bacterium]